LITLNFTGKEVVPDVGLAGEGNVLLSTELDRAGKIALDEINLRPHEGLIIAF